jgi:hypothetical protein
MAPTADNRIAYGSLIGKRERNKSLETQIDKESDINIVLQLTVYGVVD